MPIPGSILNNLIDPTVVDSSGLFYNSLCTYMKITKTSTGYGRDTHTFAAMDAAHTNVPCRKSPIVMTRPEVQEKSAVVNRIDAKFHLSISKYFNDMDNEGQMVVDGATYEILAIEPDGSKLTTRVMLGKLIPFNA